MATVASQVPPRTTTRRSPASTPQPSSSIAKGATARSAVSPRVNSSLTPGRRASLKAATPPRINGVGETKEILADSLRRETDEKEQLLVQLQNKEQTISSLTTENAGLSSALNAAETRLTELYADQARMEEEMAARMDITEKLRNQVRDLEKEKRDSHRRYNEQTSIFEAERHALYEHEQHLKSRIQSLTQVRNQAVPGTPAADLESEAEDEEEEANDDAQTSSAPQPLQDVNDPETEPAEMTSLKLELSTLSTSYSSLQSTLILLQTQLHDLKRVNNELQEENESYNILLTEKTLNGQFDLLKQVGTGSGSASSEDGDDESPEMDEIAEKGSLTSTRRSILDRVDEIAEEETLDDELQRSLEPQEQTDSTRPARARRGHRRGTSSSSKSHSPTPHGESLADLPITGPGLDLAAELGRAENKDILDGNIIEDRDRSVLNTKPGKRSKKGTDDSAKKISSSGVAVDAVPTDLETLRTEVKSLKDANKALSLYASKIIDRIIAQEGFEHVLAIDYDKIPPSPNPKSPAPPPTTFNSPPPESKTRRQSISILTSASPRDTSTAPTSPVPTDGTAKPTTRSRRSLSFDWRSFSMFGGDRKPDLNGNLRPLTLKPGSNAVTGARKLETHEDEDDRRERERMIATMKLMGIDKPTLAASAAPPLQKSYSAPGPQPAGVSSPTPSYNSSSTTSRFSLFRSRSTTNSEASSLHSSPNPQGVNLTQEALEQAEAENKLAALDAHERQLSAEIAKGASGGFTEISRSRKGRRSAEGSGSTVWSAGMSKNGEDGDE